MSTITRLKSQKNQNRVNVYLDSQFVFGMDLDRLVKTGLKVGQEIPDEEIEKLRGEEVKGKLLDQALKFLSYRPRTEKEVRIYLEKRTKLFKGNIAIAILDLKRITEKILKKLEDMGLIDDKAFVAWWLEQRTTFRPRGKQALRMELRQKGIAESLVDEMVGRVDEIQLAQKIAQKKLKSYQKLDQKVFRQKMVAFLSRRGFSWETIKTVLEQLSQKE